MSRATTVAFDPALGYAVPLSSEKLAVNVANSATAYTLPDGFDVHRITLNGVTPALTMPTAAVGAEFTLELVQDGTGSRIPTFSASAKFPAATVPTWSTGANKVDRIRFLCTDGTTFGAGAAVLDIR